MMRRERWSRCRRVHGSRGGGVALKPPGTRQPTNKPLSAEDLQVYFTNAELEQLIEARVLAVERHNGFRILKGITTTTGSAFSQITTRRIVDFAKFGVRSAADPSLACSTTRGCAPR